MNETTTVSTVRKSETLTKLAPALSKAQGEMKNPPKDSINPHFKSKYADLATVRDTVMPVLTRHGLSVLQLPCECDGHPALTTILLHDSGEWVETTIMLHGKTDPQGIGSALTYMRRYTLQALAGVAADEDDDGNAASRPTPQQQQQSRQQKPAAVKDNPQLRAKHTQAFAQAKSREDCDRIGRVISADVKLGELSENDRLALRSVAEQAYARVSEPAKA
jgi:hypothetical protein